MILIFDGRASPRDRLWERVDLETLNPDDPDDVDVTDNEEASSEFADDYDDALLHQPIPPGTLPTQGVPDVPAAFTLGMSKRVLKNYLQTSFRVQWLKGKLQWPKQFRKVNKLAVGGSLTRAALEVQQSLRGAPSTLRALDPVTKQYTRTIGKGLFHSLSLKRDELVAYYVGTWRSQIEFDRLCLADPVRQRYGIKCTEHSLVLDTWECVRDGLCVASYANSPKGCLDTTTGRKAVANARIVPNFEQRRICIRVGVNKPLSQRSPDNFWIVAGTEILVAYGASYTCYD